MLAFEEDRAMLRHVLRAARRTGVLEDSGSEDDARDEAEGTHDADAASREPVAS
jgi:hypothetical protein